MTTRKKTSSLPFLIGLFLLLALVGYSAATSIKPGVRGVIVDHSTLQDEELHQEFNDATTEEEIRFLQADQQRVNILQKLGESIGLAIVGCLLICVAVS
jgi:hypothetical protein